MILRLIRYIYETDRTIGKLFSNEMQPLCFTLEDVVRKNGAKIPTFSAISDGLFEITICFSNRFQRSMPLLLNVPNFSGIRMHGGNKPTDTDGCILLGKNLFLNVDGSYVIQETQEKLVTAYINRFIKTEKVYINIINTHPYYGVE